MSKNITNKFKLVHKDFKNAENLPRICKKEWKQKEKGSNQQRTISLSQSHLGNFYDFIFVKSFDIPMILVIF